MGNISGLPVQRKNGGGVDCSRILVSLKSENSEKEQSPSKHSELTRRRLYMKTSAIAITNIEDEGLLAFPGENSTLMTSMQYITESMQYSRNQIRISEMKMPHSVQDGSGLGFYTGLAFIKKQHDDTTTYQQQYAHHVTGVMHISRCRSAKVVLAPLSLPVCFTSLRFYPLERFE
ncbi:hypothetical protein DINM_002315 [Dirofilaria immitis]|nr:hypothetical protein [Dirofilaria immitis]